MPASNPGGTLRLIAKLLRELVTASRFTDYSSLKDALRRRLRRLGIRYQQHEFDDAYSLVGSNTRLVRPEPAIEAPQPPEIQPLSRVEAAEIVAGLVRRGAHPALKVMPSAGGPVPIPAADRLRRARIVAQAIVDIAYDCDAREDQVRAAAAEPKS